MSNKRNLKNHAREKQRAEKRRNAKATRAAATPSKSSKLTATKFIEDFAGGAFEIHAASSQTIIVTKKMIENIRKAKEADPNKWDRVDPTPLVDVVALFENEAFTNARSEAVTWAGELEDYPSMATKVAFVEKKSEAMVNLGIMFNDAMGQYENAMHIVQHMIQSVLNPMEAPVTVLDDDDTPVEFTAPVNAIVEPDLTNTTIMDIPGQAAQAEATYGQLEEVITENIEEKVSEPVTITPVSIVNSDGAVKAELTQEDCNVLNEVDERPDSVSNTTDLTPPPPPLANVVVNEEDTESAVTLMQRDNPLYSPNNI